VKWVDYLSGDVDNYERSIKVSFGTVEIPPEILIRGKENVSTYLSSFFPVIIKDTMRKVADDYWDKYGIGVKE
jgi:hypothetical protein